MTRESRVRLTLIVLLGLTVLRAPLAYALQMLLPDASVAPELTWIASAVQSLVMFALPGWLLMPRWQAETGKGSGLRGWGLWPLAAMLTREVATPLNAWWVEMTGAPVYALPVPEKPVGLVLIVLAVAVIPAVAEEMFFRGALLTNLLQTASRTQALLLTTLMFALLHGSLAGLPGHLLISLVLTLLMMHTGRLGVPIAAHMVFNLLALVQPSASAWIGWCCGAVLAVGVIWMLLRLPQGRDRRLPVGEALLCGGILAAMAAQYFL